MDTYWAHNVGLFGSLTLLHFAFCRDGRRFSASLVPYAVIWHQPTTHAVAFCCKMRARLLKILANITKYVFNKITALARSLKI